MPIVIHIENASGEDKIPDPESMRQWIRSVLSSCKLDQAELSVRIVDEEEMSALNSQFRHKNRPTNVLSFPAHLQAPLEIPLLGDIAVCAQVVKQEAVDQEKSGTAHWAHMLVHGTLHLLGYDHIEDSDAQEMEALEIKLITRLGFPPPYEEMPAKHEGEHHQ